MSGASAPAAAPIAAPIAAAVNIVALINPAAAAAAPTPAPRTKNGTTAGPAHAGVVNANVPIKATKRRREIKAISKAID